MLIPRMLDDMLKIVLDPVFNTEPNGRNCVYPVDGYENDDNLWESILKLSNWSIMNHKNAFFLACFIGLNYLGM